MGQNGGKRPGAGRKPGSKSKKTLEKEVAAKLLNELVIQKIKPLVEAKLAVALGIKKSVPVKNKKGKTEYHEVYSENPNSAAIEDLFNRVLGKPKDGLDNLGEGIKELGEAVRQILQKK